MILSVIRILPNEEERSGALELLRSVQGPTLAAPGCVSCVVCEEDGPVRCILFFQGWETEAELEAHVRSTLYRRILAAMELSGEQPEVSFHRVASTEGMDLIHKLRSHDEVSATPEPTP